LFTISAKGVYGLTALLELGERYPRSSVQIRDIASAHNIPQHYLEQILVILKKAGFVESFRGAQGGYALAREPRQVQVLDILTNLEGKLEVVSEDKQNNALNFFWKELDQSIRDILDLTLEDLIERKQKQRQTFTYSI